MTIFAAAIAPMLITRWHERLARRPAALCAVQPAHGT
jgi:hypothetical protein